MVQITVSYPEFRGNVHKFKTAMEACRFLAAIPQLPDDARVTIRIWPTARYRVVCHTPSGPDRWLRVMANGTIRTCHTRNDATILPTREEAYRYCDQANLLRSVDYAAPEVV
jgi:hypothetical protein